MDHIKLINWEMDRINRICSRCKCKLGSSEVVGIGVQPKLVGDGDKYVEVPSPFLLALCPDCGTKQACDMNVSREAFLLAVVKVFDHLNRRAWHQSGFSDPPSEHVCRQCASKVMDRLSSNYGLQDVQAGKERKDES